MLLPLVLRLVTPSVAPPLNQAVLQPGVVPEVALGAITPPL